MRLASLLVFFLAATQGWGVDFTRAIPENCRAVVLVTATDWASPQGTLRRFERADGHAAWRTVGAPAAVLLGEHGMAWGAGLAPMPSDNNPHKTEGDRRAPAGIFAFGTAFGRAPRENLPWVRMPYRRLSLATEAVDDPESRFYNQIVERTRITQPDWRSSEHMGKVPAYELGIVIGANPQCVPGGGSCLFLHLWTKGRTGTSGCTALHEADLEELMRWLDPAKHPVLVQLPEAIARTSLSGF